jgi:hypothetical protein
MVDIECQPVWRVANDWQPVVLSARLTFNVNPGPIFEVANDCQLVVLSARLTLNVNQWSCPQGCQ